MNIITVGIDLPKNVFAVHSVNDSCKPVLVKVSRADLLPLIAQLPPCLSRLPYPASFNITKSAKIRFPGEYPREYPKGNIPVRSH